MLYANTAAMYVTEESPKKVNYINCLPAKILLSNRRLERHFFLYSTDHNKMCTCTLNILADQCPSFATTLLHTCLLPHTPSSSLKSAMIDGTMMRTSSSLTCSPTCWLLLHTSTIVETYSPTTRPTIIAVTNSSFSSSATWW